MQSLSHPLKTIQPQVENRNFRRSAIREITGSARYKINLINTTINSFYKSLLMYFFVLLIFTSIALYNKNLFVKGDEESKDTLIQ